MQQLTVDIYYDSGHLTLAPAFFTDSTITKIRKVFKLLKKWKHNPDNKAAFDNLDQFFPAWLDDLNTALALKTAGKKRAEQEARTAESQVACFGTMATKEMKAAMIYAQREAKAAVRDLKRAKAALERYEKIINAYKEILR